MLKGILEGIWSDLPHKGGPAQTVTQLGLESLSAQMETAHGLGRRLRWFYISVVHKLALQIAALLLPSTNNVLILSFLHRFQASYTWVNLNNQGIGARIRGHHFHQQC